jgi:hypothetical protein
MLSSSGNDRDRSVDRLRRARVVLTTYSIMETDYRRQQYGFKRRGELVREPSPLHAIAWHRIVLDEGALVVHASLCGSPAPDPACELVSAALPVLGRTLVWAGRAPCSPLDQGPIIVDGTVGVCDADDAQVVAVGDTAAEPRGGAVLADSLHGH